MRYTLLAMLACAVVTAGAEQPIDLDTPVKGEFRVVDVRSLDRCDAGAVVAQIARKTGIPTGFENSSECWLSAQIGDVGEHQEVLTGMSVRQALDRLMTQMPGFSWRYINGVIVVRPRTAWQDPDDILNRPAKPFSATRGELDTVLHSALEAVTPPIFIPHDDVKPPQSNGRMVTVDFRGGTMLDALNAIVRAHPETEWQIGYGAGRATVVVSPFDIFGDVAMAPVAIRQAQR